MLNMILHQLWNQRRQNGWIFVELLVVSFFLWTVTDPIYVLTANRSIDRGYRAEGAYVVQLHNRMAGDAGYDPSQATDSLRKQAYRHIARLLRGLPEVESYCIARQWSIPNGGSWSGTQLYPDTASVNKEGASTHAQWYGFVAAERSDLFAAYGMTDARTGRPMTVPEGLYHDRAFISEHLARRLFGTVEAVGRKVYSSKTNSMEVAGVFRDYKHRDYEQPYPLIVLAMDDMEGGRYMNWQYPLVLRLREGADAAAFERRFKAEVAPALSIGNFYFGSLRTMTEISDRYAAKSGVTNKLRLQYILAGFAMLCIFLGMVGTFWIRCNARHQEIGLMCSLGASRSTVCRQFLLEAWMLVTVAFAVVLPLLLHRAWMEGFYTVQSSGTPVPDPAYWQNRFGPHFLAVTALSYGLLLLVALLGTYIPARRAARTLPAEALRDE